MLRVGSSRPLSHASLLCLLALVMLLAAVTAATPSMQAQTQRTVLLDAFTNAHCSPCRQMYTAYETQIAGTELKDNVVSIFHHWRTYADDKLYQYNMEEPNARAQFLGGVFGTPTMFVEGERLAGSWSNLGPTVTAAIALEQRYSIATAVMREEAKIVVRVAVQNLLSDPMPVVLYAAVVEDLQYKGRNGVEHHSNVFRRGLTSASGQPLSFDASGHAVVTLELPWDDTWVADSISVVTAVQSPSGEAVYEAADDALTVTASVDVVDEIMEVQSAEIYSLTGQLLSKVAVSGNEDAATRAGLLQASRSGVGGAVMLVLHGHGRMVAKPIILHP